MPDTIFVKHHDYRRAGSELPALERNPSNLETPWGSYHRVFIRAGDVYHARSSSPTPAPLAPGGKEAFESIVRVTSTHEEGDPRIGYDLGSGAERLWLLYTHTEGSATWVYEQFSDTDGEDWSPAASVGSMVKHPEHCFHEHLRYRVWWDGGTLFATEFAGNTALESFSLSAAAGGGALTLADDSYRISYGVEGAERPVLTCIIAGESAVSEWESWDDLRTWKRIGS
jgi:hypothetical protein